MGKMITRVITLEEYSEIMQLLINGFEYEEPVYDGLKIIEYKKKKFRPNAQVALALKLEANLGLRISDILRLKVKSFKRGKFQITEKKTGELQYRKLNSELYNDIVEYTMERGLKESSDLFDITTKAVHKQLRIICNYLELENVSTHSFRKMYATRQYELNGNDIALVSSLLNHSSVSITEKYVRLNQKVIDKASEEYYIG